MGFWDFLGGNTNTNKGAGTYQGLVRGDGSFNTFGSGTANAPAKMLNRKNTILGMSPDKFSQLFGSMGQAIAPNTPMGRLGGIAAGMATRNIERERKAPGRALDRRSKLLDIKQKEKNLNKVEKGTPHYVEDASGNVSVFIDGKLKSGSGKGKPVKSQSYYHYETDDLGNVSVFKNGVKVSGLGKGKTVKKGFDEKLHNDRMDAYLEENPNASMWEAQQAVSKNGAFKSRKVFKDGASQTVYSPEKLNDLKKQGWTQVNPGKGDSGKAAQFKRVTARLKEWDKDNSYASAQDRMIQGKKYTAADNARLGLWQIKYGANNEIVYVDEDGFMRDELGDKIERKPFTENGTTYHPIPQRP